MIYVEILSIKYQPIGKLTQILHALRLIITTRIIQCYFDLSQCMRKY